ncbi:hypothetical protein LPAF129_08200 [Ligilactobacillus pabuli]|uniref:Uncharacterized protein n=1 Tax=Ligilactobacillus pabuli TaxID=2886039 RepID=A0ABQ5JIZ6_9LACO|nr:hypothetical protein LPAF129_08200 [Ligilactobacillus pabuli]
MLHSVALVGNAHKSGRLMYANQKFQQNPGESVKLRDKVKLEIKQTSTQEVK